jgi:CheY-like chemotaxis protein
LGLKTRSSINVLLADDDKDDCLFFQEILEEISISTTFKAVYDGEYLMQYLENQVSELPDVLFLDINMPRKTGMPAWTN